MLRKCENWEWNNNININKIIIDKGVRIKYIMMIEEKVRIDYCISN